MLLCEWILLPLTRGHSHKKTYFFRHERCILQVRESKERKKERWVCRTEDRKREREREWKIGYYFSLVLSSSLIGQARGNWGIRTSWAKISSAAAAGPDVLGWARVATKYTHTHTRFHQLDRASHDTQQHRCMWTASCLLPPCTSKWGIQMLSMQIFTTYRVKHTNTHTHSRLYWGPPEWPALTSPTHISGGIKKEHPDYIKSFSAFQAFCLWSYPGWLAMGCCVQRPVIIVS